MWNPRLPGPADRADPPAYAGTDSAVLDARAARFAVRDENPDDRPNPDDAYRGLRIGLLLGAALWLIILSMGFVILA